MKMPSMEKTMTSATATSQDFRHFHGMLCHPRTAAKCIDAFQHGKVLFAAQEVYDEAQLLQQKIDVKVILQAYDHDAHNPAQGRPPQLTVFSYYMLVVLSFTGPLSLIGRTKLLKHCSDEIDVDETMPIVSESLPDELTVPPQVMEYILDRQKDKEEQGTAKVAQNSATVGVDKSSQTPSNPKNGDGNPDRTQGSVSLRSSLKLVERFEFQFGSLVSVMMIHLVCTKTGDRHLVETYRAHSNILSRIASFAEYMMQLLGRRKPDKAAMTGAGRDIVEGRRMKKE